MEPQYSRHASGQEAIGTTGVDSVVTVSLDSHGDCDQVLARRSTSTLVLFTPRKSS